MQDDDKLGFRMNSRFALLLTGSVIRYTLSYSYYFCVNKKNFFFKSAPLSKGNV